MTRFEIKNHLQIIFTKVIGKENIVLEDTTTAKDVQGWDSLSHASIIVEIEKLFNIKFSIRDMMKWKNVGKMIDSIEAKINN